MSTEVASPRPIRAAYVYVRLLLRSKGSSSRWGSLIGFIRRIDLSVSALGAYCRSAVRFERSVCGLSSSRIGTAHIGQLTGWGSSSSSSSPYRSRTLKSSFYLNQCHTHSSWNWCLQGVVTTLRSRCFKVSWQIQQSVWFENSSLRSSN